MTVLRRSVVAVASFLRGSPPLEELSRRLIARFSAGKTFADVGAMWGVHGAYAFHAVDCGATAVTAVDGMDPTPEFERANAASRVPVRFVQGDINDAATIAAIGEVETVFCSGVLYHVPDPIFTLTQLRRVARETLILASATVPELEIPQAAVLLAYLDDDARRRLAYRTGGVKLGLDNPFDPSAGYANWYWALTPSSVIAMLRTARFTIRERYPYRHALCVVAEPF